ncbi:MAG: hypothetical protein QOE19_3353, partial [Actinomycetota bacterium]|nr:hypothetical protein [Actinomycetota bacterium]
MTGTGRREGNGMKRLGVAAAIVDDVLVPGDIGVTDGVIDAVGLPGDG